MLNWNRTATVLRASLIVAELSDPVNRWGGNESDEAMQLMVEAADVDRDVRGKAFLHDICYHSGGLTPGLLLTWGDGDESRVCRAPSPLMNFAVRSSVQL